MTSDQTTNEIRALKERIASLEKQWREEHCIIELLVASGHVSNETVGKARDLAESLREDQ